MADRNQATYRSRVSPHCKPHRQVPQRNSKPHHVRTSRLPLRPARRPHRAAARAAAFHRGRAGGAGRADAGAGSLRPHQRQAQRRRFLPSRPPADLSRDQRAGGKEPPLRCGDPGRVVRIAGPDRTGRRRRLPGRTGQHHAFGRQYRRLRRDRARQGGDAAADRGRHRDHQRRLPARRPRQRRTAGQGRAGSLRHRRGRRARAHRFHRGQHRAEGCVRGAAEPLRERRQHHRPADRLPRVRRDDRRPAADRPADPGRAPGDGQDHAGAEHRRVRRDQVEEGGGRVLDGNVGLAAGLAPDFLQRPGQRHPPAHRPAGGRGLEPRHQRHPHAARKPRSSSTTPRRCRRTCCAPRRAGSSASTTWA